MPTTTRTEYHTTPAGEYISVERGDAIQLAGGVVGYHIGFHPHSSSHWVAYDQADVGPMGDRLDSITEGVIR